ncbi:hypothetical protein DFH07DRAFT_244609 [Mycena maculata]|uniref:PH domain-containing protein n=1 Tax=Mycena maculata TaxID=230809 RepID=A0AAD7HQX7_9AGAR|nr:hypothetical protein DFH07DRAFT_244609 [Mycena maculata]
MDRDLALQEFERATRTIIPMEDIAKHERTEVNSYCLMLKTKKRKKYLLMFKNDDDLYEWQDAICYRSMGVSNPWNLVHDVVHVGVEPAPNVESRRPHIDVLRRSKTPNLHIHCNFQYASTRCC